MPFSAGVVQDAGVPLRPAISTRHRRHEPNASKESVAHGFAKVPHNVDILHHPLAAHDLFDGFGPSLGADAAGRAFAAGLDGAEMEGKTGLFGEVDTVVEHHDAAMSHHAALGGEGLVVE